MPTVKIDGSEMELPDDICKSDKSLRDALTPFYPGAANSDIKRETKGDKVVITVTKRAGSKGVYAPVFSALDATPESFNPAFLLDLAGKARVKSADLERLLTQALVEEGEINRVAAVLDGATPAPSADVPEGF